MVVRATGARGLAREVARLGRRQGCVEVVVCLEPGWPGRGRSRGGLRSLAAALSSFRHAELVVTGDVVRPGDGGDGWDLLAPLWAAVETVIAGSEEVGASLRAAGAPAVTVCDPYEGAGLVRRSHSAGTVAPFEHGELLLRVRGRRLLGALARKVLGRRAPAVRSFLSRPARWVQRARSPGS